MAKKRAPKEKKPLIKKIMSRATNSQISVTSSNISMRGYNLLHNAQTYLKFCLKTGKEDLDNC